MRYKYCIVGGGIVGLATAYDLLQRDPGASLVLLEKESSLGLHQSGHNSGVIHAGVYYEPGSLKARLCREGAQAIKAFCANKGVSFAVPGKLIVATTADEEQRLDALASRAVANGVEIRRIGRRELNELEPEISGLGAILVEATGIVNYRDVSKVLGDEIRTAGGKIHMSAPVTRIDQEDSKVKVGFGRDQWIECDKLVVCGGLQADRLAKMAGIDTDVRIIPFRGIYYRLPESKSNIARHLIYPVPDPTLPFLGIHLTRMIDGSMTVGPNATLSLSRERYETVLPDPKDLFEIVTHGGFWKLAGKHFSYGVEEFFNSVLRRRYLEQCRKYCPSLELSDLLPYPTAIRAQAVDAKGVMIHDFRFEQTERMIHVLNAPSPAATSSLLIGRMIGEIAAGQSTGPRNLVDAR